MIACAQKSNLFHQKIKISHGQKDGNNETKLRKKDYIYGS